MLNNRYIIKTLLTFTLLAAVSCFAKIKVACVGDSITFGASISSNDLKYPAQLGKLLGDEYDVKNFGVSGSTLLSKGDKPYVKESAYKNALEFEPNIVIIKLGTNDSKPHNWSHSADFEGDMDKLIDSFEALSSKPKVYLCIPTYAPESKWGISEQVLTKETSPIVRRVAKKRSLTVIDMYEALYGYPDLFPDGIHPNAMGAYRMAAKAYNVLTGKDAPLYALPLKFPPDKWKGYDLYTFSFMEKEAKVAVPHLPKEGNLWIWRPAFFGAFPSADLKLLENGYYVVYFDLTHEYGSPAAVELATKFYRNMVLIRGLNKKVVLEGFSRGGLMAMNWAKQNPDCVSCIYLDAPVCSLQSWPSKKNEKLWAEFLSKWKLKNFDESFKGNAYDGLDALAKAKVPILIVSGDSDKIVPFKDNGAILKEKYEALGGSVKTIIKPACDHHPHSLENPAEIVEFVEKYSKK